MHKSHIRSGVAVAAVAALMLAGCASGTTPTDPPTEASDGTDWDALEITAEAQAAMQGYYDAAIESDKTSVMIYVGHADEWQGLFDAFGTIFPGVEVKTTSLLGAELQSTLEAEAATGKHVVDVLTNPNLNRYRDMGFTQKFMPETFSYDPALAGRIDESQMKDPEGHYFSPSAIVFGMAYNTDNVDPADLPTVFADFGDPEWAGKLTSQTPTTPGGLQGIWTQLYMAGLADDEVLTKISANTTWQAQDALAMAAISSGASAVQPFSAASAVALAQNRDGAPVGIEFAPFSIALTQKWGVANGAPSPDVAKLFLNFLNTKEGQKYTLENGYFPLDQYDDLESPYGYPTLGGMEFVNVPANPAINAATAEYLPGWKAIIGG